jgi:hypothetical protein
LWEALDKIRSTARAASEFDTRLIALRLELHLLLEALDSGRCRAMLTVRQRGEVRTLIRWLLRGVSSSAHPEPLALMQEQNVLFDAVLALHR